MSDSRNTQREPRGKQDLADKVLHRIEEERVTPRPRWQYVLKNVVFWLIWIVSLLLGAAAMAAVWFSLVNTDWTFWPVTHANIFRFALQVIPFLWIVAFLAMLVIGYENVRHTKHGYRYPFFVIVLLGLIGSVVGGAVLYRAGVGELVEEEWGRRIPLYHPTLEQQRVFWIDPARGLLAGDVVHVAPDFGSFVLRSFDGRQWVVAGGDLSDRDRAVLDHEPEVRVIGLPVSPTSTDSSFHSCFVFPWRVPSLGQPAFIPRDHVIPHPFDEINGSDERSTECKGVRPYLILKALRQQEAQP